MRVPVPPMGWPSAIAPPLTLSLSDRDRQVLQHREHLRGERFVQLDEIEVVEREPGLLQQLLTAGTGPMPIRRGSTPALAQPMIRASGFSRRAFAGAALMTTTAAPPSVTPDEDARGDDARVPFDSPKTSGSLRRLSIVVPGRGCSSAVERLRLALAHP